MAFWSSVAGLMVALVAATIVLESTMAAATNHVVGGSTGWTIPPNTSFYMEWSSSNTFAVGDTLEFDFTTGGHEVVHVPKSDYDSCSTTNKIGSILTTGPANVTLSANGSYYYICGFTGHCSNGQKLAITVGSSGTTAPTSAPPATPGSGNGNSMAASLSTGFSLAVAVLSAASYLLF